MKNNELLEKTQKPAPNGVTERKVTFSVDETKNDRQFTPYKKMQAQPNFSIMKKKIMLFLGEGKYEEANAYIQSYIPQQIKEFFLNKGEIVFRWALIYCSNPEPIAFLASVIPTDIVEEILGKNNFSMLVCFFGSQSMLDQDGHYNLERVDNATSKIKTLLSLNIDKINKVIEDSISKDFITENVKKCVQKAKLQTI